MQPKPPYRVFIGFDAAEMQAHNVAATSLHTNATHRHDVRRVALDELQARRMYTRPTQGHTNGQLWDVISEASMSTGHAIARFFVPWLCRYEGWALFTDGDVLFRSNVEELFALADPRYAVMVVKHPPMPEQAAKKEGHAQTVYHRKNWSSVMLFNCAHTSNLSLWKTVLNQWPGRDLHAFKWLPDQEVGELPAGWNYLVNAQPQPETVHLAHYTLGVPSTVGHESDPFADEWRAVSTRAGYKGAP